MGAGRKPAPTKQIESTREIELSKTRCASHLVIAAFAASALVACGSSPVSHLTGSSQATGAASATTASASPATTGSAGASATNSAAAKVPASAKGPSGYPQYMAGTIPARVTVSLASTCVRPGFTQQLTVQTTPGYYVSFDVQYADHKEGATYGGRGYGPVPTGGYVMRWIVGTDAPAGTATVFVAVEGGKPMQTAFRQPTFQVGSC